MSQDVKLIQPRETGILLPDGTAAWAMIPRGGGYSKPSGRPNLGGGGVTKQHFKIVFDGGDFWRCKPWDGTTAGIIEQNIIKPFKLRAGTNKIASEVILGVTNTYTYTPVTVGSVVGYYTRSVSMSDGNTEINVVVPFALVNDIIVADPISTGIISIATTIAAITLVNPGTGGTYAVNDVLTVAGGTGTAATIKVLTVAAGKIATVQLLTAGNYTANPSLSANAVTGGGGSGATFNLTLATPMLDANDDGRAWSEI